MFNKRKSANELNPSPLVHENPQAMQIRALFDAEWARPTDEAREIRPH